MSRTRRSSWVAPQGDAEVDVIRRPRARGRRRRPWAVAASGIAGVATVVTIATALVGVDASPALAVCDADGGSCVDAAADARTTVAVLPLEAGSDTLTVTNDRADGEAEIGVVGYLTSDDVSASAVSAASPSTSATVRLGRSERGRIRLTGVPKAAKAVILQTGSSFSRSRWQSSRAACASTSTSAAATGSTAAAIAADPRSRSCGAVSVAFSGRHDRLSGIALRKALEDWAKRRSSPSPSASTVTAIADTVQPAALAAAIAPGEGSLAVSWQLDARRGQVDAIRVTRSGGGGSTEQVDRPARSGGYTWKRLTAGTAYTVSVAIVKDGVAGSPITMTAAPLASGSTGAPTSTPSASPSGSPSTTPSTTPTATPSASASASPSASVSPSASASPSSSPSSRPSTRPTRPSSGGSSTPTTTPSSAAPSAPSTGSSGTGLPGTNAYSGWTRVIAQDFDTDAAVGSFASKYSGWAGYDGNTSGASGTTWNSSSTMSVSNSVLRMRNWVSGGKAQAGALTPVVSGTPWYSMGQTYGKYVVRFKADSVRGFKVAWLLWPTSNNWNEGEIDFPEANLDGTVNWSSHDVTGNPSNQTWGATGTRMGDGAWHTATTTWEQGKVTFELDGSVVKTVTDSRFLPKTPMRWALQNETSTDGTRAATSADGSVYIDWVAQYKRG